MYLITWIIRPAGSDVIFIFPSHPPHFHELSLVSRFCSQICLLCGKCYGTKYVIVLQRGPYTPPFVYRLVVLYRGAPAPLYGVRNVPLTHNIHFVQYKLAKRNFTNGLNSQKNVENEQ